MKGNESGPEKYQAYLAYETMSIGGVLLAVITASFLKPLLSTNESIQLPTVTVYDPSNGLSPWEASNLDLKDATQFVLTLHLPSPQDTNAEVKRQFDPWGGKRFSSDNSDDDGKRQFSPWGGKRSDPESNFLNVDDNHPAVFEVPVKYRANQGNFNPSNAERNFHSWGGKRHSNTKRGYLSGGENTLQWWRGKRNFNSWGGKKFVNDVKEDTIMMMNKNIKTGDKRQAFNSWGGKRASDSWNGEQAFNSWGGKRASDSWNGKRAFNSWGGKQLMYSEPELKDPNSEDDLLPTSYNAVGEETERNMR